MARVFLLILDSFGIGGAPDAKAFRDEGANTLKHIRSYCETQRQKGPLAIENLDRLGLAQAANIAIGDTITDIQQPTGLYGAASEISNGKDTPSGHWEIAGQPVKFDWGYFPKTVPAFPKNLTDKICGYLGVDKLLGNCHASGTDIIEKYGLEHMQTGQPICYTSTDSVLQIAAHETTFGLEKLYALCAFTRTEIDELNIGRVIARPFTGDSPDNFVRTGNRKDYSVLPPAPTVLNLAQEAGHAVIGIGKISDIYAHQGITQSIKANGNMALFDQTLNVAKNADDKSLVITNFVDFDMLYGHRRDIEGYAQALEDFDQRLPELEKVLKPNDLVIITADHGCDPSWPGTDHTRERVPVLAFGPNIGSGNIGVRHSFCDIGASIAKYLDLPPTDFGTSFL